MRYYALYVKLSRVIPLGFWKRKFRLFKHSNLFEDTLSNTRIDDYSAYE